MKKFLYLSIILFVFACKQYNVTTLTEDQNNKILELSDLIDKISYSDKLSMFTNTRNAFSSQAEINIIEDQIISDLESYGYIVETQEINISEMNLVNDDGSFNRTVTGPFSMRNIISTKKGQDSSLKPILIGAHHDTVSNAPGTNDNGSGCAGVLNIAEVLKDNIFERDIVFTFFAFEEDGLIGSSYYVDNLPSNRYPESVIILEMIGFTSDKQSVVAGADLLLNMPLVGNFIGVFGSTESKELTIDYIDSVNSINDLFVYSLALDDNFGSNPVLADVSRSDHTSFWVKGIPAIMVTDTANLRVNNTYHTLEDNFDNIDLDFATNVTKASLIALCRRAGIK